MNILAIDQGTSATKAVVIDAAGNALAATSVALQARYPAADAVELPAEELWQSVVSAGRQAVDRTGVRIDAVGLANQGESVVAWDRDTGRPLSDAILWQDRRSSAITAELAPRASELREMTGLPLDPYFAAPKMAWLRREVGHEGVITTTDSWLIHRLTGEFVTDASTASRTQLMDLDGLRWSSEACTAFGIDPTTLPEIVSSTGSVGLTSVFGREAPLTGICLDQGAALYGHGCFSPGDTKCTYGTGAFLLANAGDVARRSENGLSTSVAWRVGSEATYCLDGQVMSVGAAFDWLARIGLLERADRIEGSGEALGQGSNVAFVPGLAGLGAPFWRPTAGGAFVGLDLATSREDLLAAVIEGIVCAVAALVDILNADLGQTLTRLSVDGGLTSSARLMQHQANLLQIPVDVHASANSTVLGIAALARSGAGGPAGGQTLTEHSQPRATYEPEISGASAEARLARWRAAVEAVVAFDAARESVGD